MKLLEQALSSTPFNPGVTDRRFSVAAGPYVCAVLMPKVVARLMREAPGARLLVRGLEASITDALDSGDIDLVIGGFEHVPERFAYRPLFSDQGVWVIRADHPAVRPGMSIEDLAGPPRLWVASGQPRHDQKRGQRELHLLRLSTWSEDALGPASRSDLDGAIVTPDSYSALSIIGQTDMAALVPRRFARLVADEGGKVILVEPASSPCAFDISGVVRQGEQVTGPVAWLLALIAETAREM